MGLRIASGTFWSAPMARGLRGRPEHLARFSDETTPDTRTTDRQKVPVYATVNEGTPIDWYDHLLAREVPLGVG